jgi:glycosyltransferase involved in cell wall biosynthesis
VLCGPAAPAGASGAATHRHLDLRREIDPRADLAAAIALARIVEELAPSIIHAHSSKAGAVARLARLAHPRIPLFYSPHGYAFNGYFENAHARRVYRAIERLLSPAATRVVCVCGAEAALARTVGPRARVRVIHNGIAAASSHRPNPEIAALAKRGPVVGALTLLRPGKGIETLIEAVPDVLERHPSARLAIVGEGPNTQELRRLAAARGVEHAVHFLGATTEPMSALAAMDVFVHPSWAESFPYVILEAMSLSRPIVASDVGGVGEAIVDRVSGLLVAPRDARALARSLIAVLDDPAAAASMGVAAATRAREHFTLAGMIDAHAQAYQEVALLQAAGEPAPSHNDRGW